MIVMEDVFCFRAKRNGRNCILYIAYMKILQYTYYIQNWCWCEKAYRCWINSLLKLRLFILLNGECPMCPMEPDILLTDAIRYDHNARYSFMTIDDFIDMGLRSSDEKKYYIENLCVAFSLLQWWVMSMLLVSSIFCLSCLWFNNEEAAYDREIRRAKSIRAIL